MNRQHSAAAAKLLRNAPRGKAVPRQWQSLDWKEFLLARGWLGRSDFDGADASVQEEVVQLLSTALTYPVTAAAALSSEDLRVNGAPPCHVCVVGARAEASLPAIFWSEMRELLQLDELRVDFVGPKACVAPVASANQLRLVHPVVGELFHESALGRRLLAGASSSNGAGEGTPDAFLCFNPGLGHPGWERAWEPTVRALLSARRPIVLSALGAHDADSDLAFWRDHVLSTATAAATLESAPTPTPVYSPNPWASLVDTAAGVGGPASRANALLALLCHK